MNREEEFKKIKANIKEIIKHDRSTTLEFDDEDVDRIGFITRANGDVAEEEASNIDIRDAENMKDKISDLYKDKIDIFVEQIDEWVYLNIRII